MDQSQLEKLESLIKYQATHEAVGYYLKHAINGRYPNSGFFLLHPFEGPEAAPSGQYQVFFTRTLSTDTPALPAHGQPDAHGRREARLCAAVPHWRGFRHCVLPRLLSDFDRFQRRRRT